MQIARLRDTGSVSAVSDELSAPLRDVRLHAAAPTAEWPAAGPQSRRLSPMVGYLAIMPDRFLAAAAHWQRRPAVG